MTAEIIDPQDEKWKNVLAKTQHDFYHLPEYVELCARYEGGRAAAFLSQKDDSSLLIPLLIKDIPQELQEHEVLYDATSPYGYPGPLTAGSGDTVAWNWMLNAFQEVCLEQKIVTAFIRLHPLMPLAKDIEKYGKLVKHGETVYIDLSLPVEDIWRQVRSGHRSEIAKLNRSGFRIILNNWDHLSGFIKLYEENMDRRSASEFYYFPTAYFQDLRSALGERLYLVTVLSPDGHLAAGSLFTENEGIVQYHLSATAEDFLRQAPMKLVLDHFWRLAKEKGNVLMHLGGGLGGQSDSLFNFKAGFSKQKADFHTFRMIADKNKYNTLIQSRNQLPGDEDTTAPDFFPLYRKGL